MNEGNNYKAKITTARGTFEFEGSQEFVEKQIEKVVDLEKNMPAAVAERETPAERQAGKTKSKASSGNSAAKKAVSTQPKMLPSLVPKEQITSLREFHDKKKPDSHVEIFAVLSYWLKENLSVADVSIDEMWTLYKVLGIRPPQNLIQVLRDAKSKKAYFDSAQGYGRYYLTSIGETFVEHDLPQAPKKKS